MQSEFVGNGRWDRDFSFLNKCGLTTVYLTILGLTQSVNDIRKLVALLPGYCRLLRNDIIRLEKFWQEEIGERHQPKGTRAKALTKAQLATFEWLLTEQCPEQQKAWEYYTTCLASKIQLVPYPCLQHGHESDKFGTLISCREMIGHGYEHFRVALFGQVFRLGCWVFPDKEHVLVRLVMWQSRLDELITYQLMGLPPYTACGSAVWSSARGSQINLTWCLPAEKLLHFLDGGKSHYSVKPGFTDTLSQALREMGMPIGDRGVVIGQPNEEL
jgi:hypothetical protein